MTITKDTELYEVLLRFENGELRGAHQQHVEVIRDNGVVISAKELNAEPVEAASLDGLLSAGMVDAISQASQATETARILEHEKADLEKSLKDAQARIAQLEAGLAAPADPNALTPQQFAYMLALNGWEETWSGVEAWAQANDLPTYAMLRAQRASPAFRLDRTLEMLAQVKTITDQIAPGVDLGEETVRTAWAAALAVVI